MNDLEPCETCVFYEDAGGCESAGAVWSGKRNQWIPTKECNERGHIHK